MLFPSVLGEHYLIRGTENPSGIKSEGKGLPVIRPFQAHGSQRQPAILCSPLRWWHTT